VCNVDFHVNYNSIKCEPSTTFVYQLNQTVLLATASRSSVAGSGVEGGGGVGGLERRSATATSSGGGGGKLAAACASVQAFDEGSDDCLRESSLLFLLLMLGTVWLGLSLYNFTKTSVAPPLQSILADRISYCNWQHCRENF